MKSVRVDSTIYTPQYARDIGQCWDSSTLRNARRIAQKFDTGSIIVRNFNRNDVPRGAGQWTQADKCLIWDGELYFKTLPIEESKWMVAPISAVQRGLLKKVSRRVDP